MEKISVSALLHVMEKASIIPRPQECVFAEFMEGDWVSTSQATPDIIFSIF
jgi:hypothetical protein